MSKGLGHLISRFVLLSAILCAGLAGHVIGQTETVLNSFGAANLGTQPTGTLIEGPDGNFYGMTVQGGTYSKGTLFKITPQGVVTYIYNFGSFTQDGAYPHGSLMLATDGSLYGVTALGGTNNLGTVFELSPTNGLVFLHNFAGTTGNDGSDPQDGLVQGGDGNFYGTTFGGGANHVGTVYMMTPQGNVTILHNFSDPNVTGDGLSPQSMLVEGADGNFYGTTPNGGTASRGMAFRITPAGVITILHSFGDGSVTNDGLDPKSALIQLPDGNFYGTTSSGSPMASFTK
jgi:uncharacterized repeat protein (TIGR03803 family)